MLFKGLFNLPVGLAKIVSMVFLISLLLVSDSPSQVMTTEVAKIADRFACQCGSCSNQVSTCPMLECGSAVPLRQEIASLIQQGMTEQQIVSAMVTKHGKVILAAPPASGFDLTVWTLPFVMLAAGLLIVYVTIKAWLRRRPVLAVGNVGSDFSVPEDYRKKMERELKEFDS